MQFASMHNSGIPDNKIIINKVTLEKKNKQTKTKVGFICCLKSHSDEQVHFKLFMWLLS